MSQSKPEIVDQVAEADTAGSPEGIVASGPPPENAAAPAAPPEPATAKPPEDPSPQTPPTAPQPQGASGSRHSVRDLPCYTRSLLKISVPVVVTLARKTQPLGKILELGPGSIIQFDKAYEEMLELDVGGRPVATGEAVKVGEKFGLRINSIILPGERFRRVQKAGGAQK